MSRSDILFMHMLLIIKYMKKYTNPPYVANITT